MVITNNLISLLRTSVFDEVPVLEPMSPWKWQEMMNISCRNALNGIVEHAVNLHEVDTVLNIPERLFPLSKKEVDYQSAEYFELSADDIDYLTQQLTSTGPSTVMLSHVSLQTRWKEKRLENIRRDEQSSDDANIEALRLLDIIVANVVFIEKRGISILYLLVLGHFLRTQGQNVDFVKLDKWIEDLHLCKMTSMMSSMLVDVFGFSVDELPFMYRYYPDASRLLYHQLEVSKNRVHIGHSASLLKYSPWGFVSYWLTLVRDSMNQIEE